MREIKFRAWCKYKKEWEKDPIYLSQHGNIIHDLGHGRSMICRPQTHIVQFYTGLRDKNGQEIYEGDILGIEKGVIGKVEWNRDEAGYRLVVRSYQGCDDFKYFVNAGSGLRDMEVIGNVYEMDS
jgi:uncharacterized phage protein (TIGR01671 family)